MTMLMRRSRQQPAPPSAEYATIAGLEKRRRVRTALLAAVIGVIVWGCCDYVGLFDTERLREGVPALFSLLGEMWPPDFSRIGSWIKPLFDTLAMSVAGTALSIVLSLPIGLAAARNTTPHPVLYHV